MAFGGVNYLAVVIAAVAAFLVGAVYYGVLGKPWMKAAKLEPGQVKPSPGIFIVSFVCELVMAWVLAGVIGHLGVGQVTLWNGVVTGFLLWLGFMATTTVVNQRYESFGWGLSLIDAGHWLLVALAMGAIIGWMGA